MQEDAPSFAENEKIFAKLAAKYPEVQFCKTRAGSVFTKMGVNNEANVIFLKRVGLRRGYDFPLKCSNNSLLLLGDAKFVDDRDAKNVYTGEFNEYSLNRFIFVQYMPLVSYWDEQVRIIEQCCIAKKRKKYTDCCN
jgi:hypothetical protein